MSRKYKCEVDTGQYDVNCINMVNKDIKKCVDKSAEEMWKAQISRKTSLQTYRKYKEGYGNRQNIIYTNSNASSLFVDCRNVKDENGIS